MTSKVLSFINMCKKGKKKRMSADQQKSEDK